MTRRERNLKRFVSTLKMQKKSVHSTTGKFLCPTRKKVEIPLSRGKKKFFKRFEIGDAAIKKYFYEPKELKSIDEVKNFIKSEMDNLDFVNNGEKEGQLYEISTVVERYLSQAEFLKNSCQEPVTKSIKAFDTVWLVSPSFVFKDGDAVQVVKYSFKKGELNASLRANNENCLFKKLESLGLLLYGKEVLDGAGYVTVCYDFLKSEADRSDDYSANWQVVDSRTFKNGNRFSFTVFFDKKGHIVFNKSSVPLDLFNLFKASYEEYQTGKKCTKDTCEKCELYEICNHTKEPEIKPEDLTSKKVSEFVLSPEQKKIISFCSGVGRANCGAGAGKTFVVIQRIIELLKNGTNPKNIMLTTFTNGGVEEMRDRLRLYIEDSGLSVNPSDITVETFNSLGGKLIDKYHRELGYSQKPTLVDEVDKTDIIVDLLKKFPQIDGLDYKNLYMNFTYVKGAVPTLSKEISFIRDNNMDKAAYISEKRFNEVASEQIYDFAKLYSERLAALNFIDYADQTHKVMELLNIVPDAITSTFKVEHLTVDECQDMNFHQLLFVSELISNMIFKSLLIVGDDSQSIYGFRGGKVEIITDFQKYMGCKVHDMYLNESYRSTPEIIDLANNFIALNTNRIDKTMVSARCHGAKPVVKGFEDAKSEVIYICDEIESLIKGGVALDDICFLSFKRNSLKKIQQELLKRGIKALPQIPIDIKESSKVQAALHLIKYLGDNTATGSLLVYVNEVLDNEVLNKEISEVSTVLNDYVQYLSTHYLTLSDKEQVDYLYELLDIIDDKKDSLYKAFLELIKGKQKNSVPQIISFVEKLDLYNVSTEVKREGPFSTVCLSTAHSSKGREWKNVFLSLTDFEGYHSHSLKDLEEIRRLLFVAITRAKDNLVITSTENYISKSEKSSHRCRFINEFRYLKNFIDAQ